MVEREGKREGERERVCVILVIIIKTTKGKNWREKIDTVGYM